MGRQLGARLLEGRAMGELGRAEQALGELAEARHWLAEAVSTLQQLGYTDVVELRGGMDAWIAAGRELLLPAG